MTARILAQPHTTRQQKLRHGRLHWLGTMLLFAGGVDLTSLAAWLLWGDLQAWLAWGRWESYTFGQWLQTRSALDLLPGAVLGMFVGTAENPAPLQDIAEAMPVWSMYLVGGTAFLWRAVRWRD
jgi:hypothetical protein